MDDDTTGRGTKRARITPEPASVEDVMYLARTMWRRDNPHQRSSAQQEDRDFRETFGKGPFVAHTTWTMLVAHDLVPENGELEHLRWTMMFVKQYFKTRAMKTACNVDSKTIKKYVWPFLSAIADLEGYLVSTVQIDSNFSNFSHFYYLLPVVDHLEQSIQGRPQRRLSHFY